MISDLQIQNIYNKIWDQVNNFSRNAKTSCACYRMGMMIELALKELKEDGFNIKYIIDDTLEKQGKFLAHHQLV